MADDDKVVEDPKEPVTPPFDAAAIGKQAADAAMAQVRATLEAQPREPVQEPVHQPVDALESVLEPYVQRGAARATLIAQMAADKADFYTVADADELEDRIAHKDEVEKRALALATQGRALPREDIYKHLKGEKFDEFVERRTKRKALREERARNEGGDHGGDGIPRSRGGDSPAYISADRALELQGKGKLDESLEGKEF